jgi:hypothetical protein
VPCPAVGVHCRRMTAIRASDVRRGEGTKQHPAGTETAALALPDQLRL